MVFAIIKKRIIHKMDSVTEQALQDLLDDYERQGNKLNQSSVDRLIEKRRLNTKQSLYIYVNLAKKGIELKLDAPIPLSDAQIKGGRSSHEQDLIRLFFKEASRTKLLTADQEKQLGRAIALGIAMSVAMKNGEIENSSEAQNVIERGNKAREKMIQANIRLVISLAQKLGKRSSLDLLDLIQEGMFGLMRAVERYDHNLGYKLSTYAVWWIRQTILRAMDDKGTTIRLPVHMAARVRKFRRAKIIVEEELGGQATLKQIAEKLGKTEEEIMPVYQASLLGYTSIDAPVNDDGEMSMGSYIPSTQMGPDEEFEHSQLSERLDEIMDCLDYRQADIVRRRFGFDGENGAETLEQIGIHYNITRERVRQLEKKALGKLSNPKRTRKIKSFLD